MTTIDARGQGCPKPVLMAEEALSGISDGVVDVLVDNEGSAENLALFAGKNGFYSESVKEDDYWRVKIAKGYACEVISGDAKPKAREKNLMLIVGTDTMGKEEDLGRVLMKGFFETLKVTKEIPHTIFFLNAGVRLTTTSQEIIPILKGLEAMGVEIFSCGTCLKHYGFESELQVGYRGTTYNIVEGLTEFKKVVWI